MIITIHQPEHLPWLGLLDKINKADLFVILDSVQFEKNYFQNRNRIKTPQGYGWLTVPVKKAPLQTLIKDINITEDSKWKKKYLKTLEMSYKKAEYYEDYFPVLEELIKKDHVNLSDLNMDIFKHLMMWFGIDKQIILSSELGIEDSIKGGSNVVLEICKKLGANTYLSGPSGRDYLTLDDFSKNNIDVIFHEFNHPQYEKQLYGEFLDKMSSIDLLFNYGAEQSRKILFG